MSGALFAILVQLLDAGPVNKAKAEKILSVKLIEIKNADSPHMMTFGATSADGPWRKFELRQPRSLGGVSMSLDFEPGAVTKAEIEKKFGPPKYPGYESGGEKILAQSYGTQTLSWVFDKDGRARRALIQDGR
jgi:hypothetical protein